MAITIPFDPIILGYVEHLGDNAEVDFTIGFPYLTKESTNAGDRPVFVRVYLDGVELLSSGNWSVRSAGNVLRFVVAPASSVKIEIVRDSRFDVPSIQWQNQSPVNQPNLQKDQDWDKYLNQEILLRLQSAIDTANGLLADITLNKLQDVTVALTPTDNDVLQFNSGTSQWENQPLDATGTVSGSLPIAAIEDMATDRLLGRDTAASGPVEQLTVGGGLAFTGSGGIESSAYTGDVTKALGGTVLTIANDAVTFAKFQNVSEARMIGRGQGSGAGDVQEVIVGTGLELTGTVLTATGGGSGGAGLSGYVMRDNAAAQGGIDAIIADHTNRTVAGDARGIEAVDLQSARASATNVAAEDHSIIGGGEDNEISHAAGASDGEWSSILGGQGNFIDADDSVFAPAWARHCSIVGGHDNLITGLQQAVFLGGGINNQILGHTIVNGHCSHAVLCGGESNKIEKRCAHSFIGAGQQNEITMARYAFIGGGFANNIHSPDNQPNNQSIIVGGGDNDIDRCNAAIIGGGNANAIGPDADHSIIAGGKTNQIGGTSTAPLNVIGGGQDNKIDDETSAFGTGINVIAGGEGNEMLGGASGCVIGGGGGSSGGQQGNQVLGDITHAVIPGGNAGRARRFGEISFGGATDALAQMVHGVANCGTDDATPKELGFRTGPSWSFSGIQLDGIDGATINFQGDNPNGRILSFWGTVVCMRVDTAASTAASFKVEGAMKKDDGGTVAFIGTPVISVLGRDDNALTIAITLAAADEGASIKVTGKAGEDYTWAFSWTGTEIELPVTIAP